MRCVGYWGLSQAPPPPQHVTTSSVSISALSCPLGTMMGLGSVVSSLRFHGFEGTPPGKATFSKGLENQCLGLPLGMPLAVASTWPGLVVVVVAPRALVWLEFVLSSWSLPLPR